MRTPHKILATLAIGATTILALASPASAHADATAEAAPQGRTQVTISLEHGCDANPTTGLRVSLPAGSTLAIPVNPAGWTSTVTTTEVDWSGGPAPTDAPFSFTMTLQLAQPAGAEVEMPTIQQCAEGAEIAWIAKDNGDESESFHPAPHFVVPVNDSVASSTTSTVANGPTTTARMAVESNPITPEGSTTHNAGLVVGGLAVAVIAIGALVLWLKYRKPSPKA
jgi:periplasmic copper chaperone A